MKCPPMLLSLKFRSNVDISDRGFGLWIPLFIIVPIAMIILLVLFLIALPFLLVSLAYTWHMGWWRWLFWGIPDFFKTMNALPGLKVDVQDRKQNIYIAVH